MMIGLIKTYIFVLIPVILSHSLFAQKVLNESETQWVNEAKKELEYALTEEGLDETERLKIIERSATTLKEYGQPSAFPDGKTPLLEQMENNFEQCKNQISDLSAMSLDIQTSTLEQKLKIINRLQIEVVERQLQILLPGGNAAATLSMELVNTVFDVNIVDGVSGGQRANAQSLKERFIQLANSNKLAQYINKIVEDDKKSLIQLNKDRNRIRMLENKWRSTYRRSTSGTITMSGYEGAKPYGAKGTTVKKTPKKEEVSRANVLVGTWKFGYEQTGYFYWTFYNNGKWKFEDKMNEGEQAQTGTYSVFGNTLNLKGPKGECADTEGIFPFIIEDGELRFKKIQDGCLSRKFTLNHVWKK